MNMAGETALGWYNDMATVGETELDLSDNRF
jgi:hypothetical protein